MINYDIPNYVSQFQPQTKILDFSDLDFQPHRSGNGVQARLDFDNGFYISVVASDMPNGQRGSFYGDLNDDDYEVAIFDDKDNFVPLQLCDDVLGWQSPLQVSNLMRDAQINGKSWSNLLHKLRKDSRDELGLDD